MKIEDIRPGEQYKITYVDSYSGRVATVIRTYMNGDTVLEFKNGKQVVYHAGWLEEINK